LDTGLHVSRPTDRTKLLWAGRTVFDVVLSGDQTAGAVSLLDQWGERGDATPMHIHHSEAEIFYVLEGGISAWFGDQVVDLDAGGALYLPAGHPHAFGIRSDSARLITITAPGGFADFISQAGVPVTGEIPSTWEFDVGRIMQAAPAHNIEIVGPPPTVQPDR
jgi:mannose-6-phosphate isomerase-like protein (cupin superfamily)